MIHLRRSTWWYLGASSAALAVGYPALFGMPNFTGEDPAAQQAPQEPEPKPADVVPRVETVHPTKGGLGRRTSQPGSAHSFESADLFPKVSGYLLTQHVDIGSRVKRGDLLAELDVPELSKDVEAATATWQQTLAEVTLAEARVESATADHKAAEAKIAQAESEVERCEAELKLNQKQFERIKSLNGLKGIEDRIVDEKQFQVQAAESAVRAARSAVLAAQQQAAAAMSKIALAKADLQVSQAKARVAESQLDRTKVIQSYTKIVSPYDGVVTARNYHRGAFVRSPDQGGQTPLLSVDRIDMMRVVVRVPERDVPFLEPGDRSTIRFDALPQRQFSGVIARIAHAETSDTRTMLAEIDLPNPDHAIRDHMYGRVEIELDSADAGVTVPSTCLVGDVANGQGRLFVVEEGHAHLKEVQVGKDSGIQVEVVSGLTEADAVVVRPAGGLAEGAEVVDASAGSAVRSGAEQAQASR